MYALYMDLMRGNRGWGEGGEGVRDLRIRNGWKIEVDDLTGSCFVEVGNIIIIIPSPGH